MMKEEVALSKEMEAAGQQPKLHQPQTLQKLSQNLTKLPPLTTDDKTLVKPQSGPSPLRSLLPITLCAISFAVVMSVLIIYMDTTEIRHQQFRMNMSRDYNLYGVPQDNPVLITYIREVQMKKNPMAFLHNAPVEHLNFSNSHDLTPEMAHYISNLVGGKQNGVLIQSLTGVAAQMLTAPWLTETKNWTGFLVEPDPRQYFSLSKQNAHRAGLQVVHACLSPTGYPKEVTFHYNDESEVRIHNMVDEETEWFHSRVKCFPLYSVMLAVNRTNIDLLSLGCQRQELQILQTIPFDKVHIELISLHLLQHQYMDDDDPDRKRMDRIVNAGYIQEVAAFLAGKSYKLVKSFDQNNFVYRYVTSTAPTKDNAKPMNF